MGLLASLDLRLLASWLVAGLGTIAALRVAFAAREVRTSDRRLVLVLSAVVLLAQVALYGRYTVDDAFISFRFARNWAEGLGPVFQAGERVEGFTSFGWVALLALAHEAGLDLETTAKALGLASALLALPVVAALARALRPGSRAELFAPLLLALSPLFAAWATAGMEAPFFALGVAVAALLLTRESEAPVRLRTSALAYGGLVLLRPEGILFVAVAFFARRARDRWGWLLLAAAVAAPYWVARWAYFGQFFPNTFYAKTTASAGQLVAGTVSVVDFVSDLGLFVMLLTVLGFLQARPRQVGDRVVFGSILAYVAYVALVGGDVLHLRFYVHVLPLCMVAAGIGAERLLEALRLRRADGRAPHLRPALAACAAGLLWTLVVYHAHARALSPHDQFGAAYVVDNGRNIRRAHIPLGAWLRDVAPAGTRVAVTDIGGFGYASRLAIVDLYGLTDRAIARLIHERAGPERWREHLHAVRPELFVLYGTSKGPNAASLASDRAWLEREYRVHSFWPDSPNDRGLVLLARNDVKLPPPPRRPAGSADGVDEDLVAR